MSEPITCNYARHAIHHFTTKHQTKKHKLPRGAYTQILNDYNKQFSDYPALKLTYGVVAKKCVPITRAFGYKWYPSSSKNEFIGTFSTKKWDGINASEKAEHTLRSCKACHTKHFFLSQSFPLKTPIPPSEIKFSQEQLSTPTQFCSKLLKDADSICRTQFHTSIEQAI